MIEIDGSTLEGGGQLIRTAVGLSAITGKAIRVFNIRKRRCGGGLKAQHLKGIEAVAGICNAKLKNGFIGSEKIEFHPGELNPDSKITVDVGTAGAITLVLQSLMIPLVHSGKNVKTEIAGGTHVKWSPSMDYFHCIFSNFMLKMGIEIHSEILKYGFYPRGGGRVIVSVKPGKLKALNLVERGEFLRNDVWSIASENLKSAKVAERQVQGAEEFFRFENKNVVYAPSLSPGTSIHMHAHYQNCRLGAGALGERGKPAERVGEEAAENLKKQVNSGMCLDEHMADQILPYLAMAEGESRVSVAEITNHCKTNIWVIEKFLPVRFEIKGNVISCRKT